MRTALVESYIDRLRASFGKLRPLVVDESLRPFYDAKDYAGMVYRIQTTLHLDLTIRLGLVNSGGPRGAPAWVERPTIMPMFGTAAFRQKIVTVYLRKTFLAEMPFDTVVIAIAHELCHVVLDAINHPLRREEEAVDLTAMLLGFRDFFVTGCRVMREQSLFGYQEYETSSLGYLSQEEVSHAAQYMTYR